MYTKAGGKGTNVCIYYSPPGQTLDNGIKLLERDAGIRELLRDYKGLNVIHLYVVENSGPIIAVDALGNIIEDNVPMPQLTYKGDTGLMEAEGINEGVDEETGVGAEAEGVNEEFGLGAEAEGVNEGVGGAEVEGVNEGVGEEFGIGAEARVGAECDGDENSEEDGEFEADGSSEDDDSNSSASECPSWMLKDLEGPMDDDLSVSRGAEYGRKLMKNIRAWVKEMKKKKRVEQENVQASVREDGWFSDVGGEDDLHSLRGSDDEIGDNLDWNDLMERQDLDLLAAINYHRQNLEDFVYPYFKKDTYLRVYSHMINPVPGMHDYEESPLGPVDPPHVVKRVGRPKKARRKDANDIREPTRVSRRGLTHTCAICGKQGHNKRKFIFKQEGNAQA
ncbi:hypothetical protein Sango_2824200 [Sesamum angolense]|uniref:Uncharacterized protein n=1 Tax=Sesamum angolense TaxID=2727404 RepID=A0AAE1T6T1_9LAMI|nr:hypothetical protein Sango_2824200 [Sesamum angolense]